MRIGRRAGAWGLGLLFVALVVSGERRTPTGACSGEGIGKGELAVSFQVATFNIHGCKGTDGRLDPARVARCLEGVDIIGLNEVHGSSWSEPSDQASHLDELRGVPGTSCLFAAAETRWFGTRSFGNGLIAGGRLLNWQRIPLSRRYDHSCRNMLVARLEAACGVVTVLVSHVARSDDRERQAQLETVLNTFGSLQPPAILLADLNTAPGDRQIERFLAESDAKDAIMDGGVAGTDRVDWILVRGLKCIDARRVKNDASDHPLYLARLTAERPGP
ncbi:MAG: endonuclease/exonuclease/phosphatase family protein [Thermoguttaceae bacterium]